MRKALDTNDDYAVGLVYADYGPPFFHSLQNQPGRANGNDRLAAAFMTRPEICLSSVVPFAGRFNGPRLRDRVIVNGQWCS